RHAGHAVAHLVHHARRLARVDHRELDRHELAQRAAAHLPVERVHARAAHGDPDLARRGMRLGHVAHLKDLRPAVLVEQHRPHGCEPSQISTVRPVDERLQAYAGLLIGTAVSLRPGQELLIDAQIGQEPLVRALAEQAYAAGARHVDVQYLDRWVKRAFVAGAPDDVLTWTPPWTLTRFERAIELGSGVIGISGGS